MIEPYNLQDSGLTNIFGNLVKNMFYIVSSVVVLWIIISLIIWFIGSNIKSEKIIKFGIRNFITSIVLQVIILSIPAITNLFT